MYERFTDRARKLMQLANQEAQRLNYEYMGLEHLFLAFMKEQTGVAGIILKNEGLDFDRAAAHMRENHLHKCPEMVTMGRLPQTPRLKKAVEYSVEEARQFGHNYVGTEHLLLGLLRSTADAGDHPVTQALEAGGCRMSVEAARQHILNILGTAAAGAEVGITVLREAGGDDPLSGVRQAAAQHIVRQIVGICADNDPVAAVEKIRRLMLGGSWNT